MFLGIASVAVAVAVFAGAVVLDVAVFAVIVALFRCCRYSFVADIFLCWL